MFARISRTVMRAEKVCPHNCRSSLSLRGMFSTKKDINRLRETARIADQVIKMIRSPFQVSELEKEAWTHESPEQQVNRVKSYALAQRIKDALMKLNTHQQSRNDVLELFTTGVEPPISIFHQARIQDARINEKLVYCPNSIISRQIFQLMGPGTKNHYANLGRFVVTGYKGISKTVSVSLLWHLVKLIDEYRFSEQGAQEEAKQKKFNHPKIVYWSIRQGDDLLNVMNSLLQQIPELKKYFTIDQLIKNNVRIGQFYYKTFGIKIQLVIDQINVLASLQRMLQAQKLEALQNPKSDTRKWNEKQQLRLQKVIQLMEQLKKISALFNRVFYLSSMDIETKFIKKSDLATDRGHSNVQICQIKYAEQIYKQQSLIDLCHFFIFEYNQKIFKIQQIDVPKKQLMDAQEMCIQHLKQILQQQRYFFTTFFNIYSDVRNKIRNQLPIQNQNLLRSVTDFKSYLFERFTLFIENTTQSVKNEVNAHLLKKDEFDFKRKITTLRLYQQILSIINLKTPQYNESKKDQKNKSIKVKQVISKSQQRKKQNIGLLSPLPEKVAMIPLQKLKLNKNSAHDILPLTFFSYNDNIVLLRIPAELTLEILEPRISELIGFYLQETNQWMDNTMTKTMMEQAIERFFVLAIKNGGISFKALYQKSEQKVISRTSSEFYDIKKGSYPFKPLKTGNATQTFLQLLKESLQKMFQRGQRCAVFQPVKTKFIKRDIDNVLPHQHHETRKLIDLIIVRFVKDFGNYKFFINVIDVTLHKEQSYINEKIINFLETFLTFSDKKSTFIELQLKSGIRKIDVQVHYFVFGQKNRDSNLFKQLKKNTTISKQLRFEGSKDVNCFNVSFKRSKKSLLRQIAFLDIETDIQFIKGKEQKDTLSFQQALNKLRARRDEGNESLKY